MDFQVEQYLCKFIKYANLKKRHDKGCSELIGVTSNILGHSPGAESASIVRWRAGARRQRIRYLACRVHAALCYENTSDIKIYFNIQHALQVWYKFVRFIKDNIQMYAEKRTKTTYAANTVKEEKRT